MIYLQKFDKHTDYQETNGDGALYTPNTSYCDNENEMHYNNGWPLTTKDFIDLGLPSGTLWCKYNIGSKNENQIGYFFQFGDPTKRETSEASVSTWENYKYGNPPSKYNSTDGKIIVDPKDDIVTSTYGYGFKTPSLNDFKELFENTTNRRSGYNWYFTSETNGNTIKFIPTGILRNGTYLWENYLYYWSSEVSQTDNRNAYYLRTDANNTIRYDLATSRYYGCNIRPVFRR